MNLRQQFMAYIVASLLAALAVAGVCAWEAQKEMLNAGYEEDLNLAAKAIASAINRADLERTLMIKDQRSPEYLEIREILQRGLRGHSLAALAIVVREEDGDPFVAYSVGEEVKAGELWLAPEKMTNAMKTALWSGKAASDPAFREGGRWFKTTCFPLISMQRLSAILISTVDAAPIGIQFGRFAGSLAIGFGFVLLIGLVLAYYLSNRFAEPLMVLAEHASRIEAGDLTQPIEIGRGKEAGSIARALSKLQAELRQILERVHEVVAAVARQTETVRQFAESLRETAAAGTAAIIQIGQVAQHSSSSFGTNLAELEDAGNILAKIDTQVISLRNAALDIRGLAVKQAGTMSEAMDLVKTAENGASRVSGEIEHFTARTQAIEEIVGSIESLATQTTTMALNATIEAARAGEYGRGFAVVAGRIQRLAVLAKESAVQIRGLLAEIAETAAKGNQAAAESKQAIAAAAGSLQGGSGTLETIAAALDKLMAEFAEIAVATAKLARTTGQTRESLQHLVDSAAQATADITKVSGTADEMSSGAGRLMHLAENLNAVANQLMAGTSKFKI